jgi:hypothetical protein
LGIVDALTSVKAADIPSRGFDSRSGPHHLIVPRNPRFNSWFLIRGM